jgi:PAS domain S-box-containing protein
VESPLESPPEELTRLRDTLNELRDIMARPALWAGGAPPSVARLSVDTLFGIASELEERVAERTRALVAANEALRRSERNSRLVIDSIPGLVALLTASGEVEFVNRQILDYTGQTLDELKQWGTNDTVHRDDLSHVIEIFTQSIASGSPYEIVQRLRRYDGTYRWFQNNGFPLRAPDGRIVRWCVLLTDVDERRRAEDALRERERELRLIVDTIPGLIAVFSADGALESANPQLCAYFGMTLEELAQWQELGNTTHPDDRERAVATFLRATELGEPFDLEVRSPRADGVYVWLHSRGVPLRNSSGQIVRWYNLLTDIDERKRAEEALRLSERNLQLIIDTIPALAWSALPDGSAEFFNRLYLDFVGRSADEMSGWGWTASVHSDDLPDLAATWQRIMTSGSAGETEARLRRHDGDYRWFLLRANPLRDEFGTIVRWYGVNTDIEDRKRAEDALRVSERNLQLTIDTIPTLVWAARADGSAEFLNQHYLDFVGLSAEEATNWNWVQAVHPDDMAGLTEAWQRQVNSEVAGDAEARLRRHDGEYRWFLFRANPLRNAEGKIIKWYGINTDIEDRKRAEMDLRRAYDSFRDAQRLSHTGSFTADIVADEHIWSDELYRICEFDPGTKITTGWAREIIHPEDVASFDAGFARSLDGADFDLTFRIVTRSGKVKHLHSIARMVDRLGGRPLFVGAIQDVTEAKSAEEALNRARSELAHVTRVTTLSTLTASIAHEVNQPLSGIITNAGTCLRMLDADPPNVDAARETAKRTIRDGHRASEVMARLRALFSKREFALEPLNLNDAIQEVIALSRGECQRSRIMIQVELEEDLPNVSGDRVQLQQVILNLLRNALDAMVDVHDRQRQLLIRTERDGGDRVRVTVRDAGVGIGAQAMDKLFDAFYTTKNDGMGIGLSISRSIIERHRGRLWAEPNDGPGATFRLSIPCTGDGVAVETV